MIPSEPLCWVLTQLQRLCRLQSAGVAHLVERHLAKVEVASSSLVTRSRKNPENTGFAVFLGFPFGGIMQCGE